MDVHLRTDAGFLRGADSASVPRERRAFRFLPRHFATHYSSRSRNPAPPLSQSGGGLRANRAGIVRNAGWVLVNGSRALRARGITPRTHRPVGSHCEFRDAHPCLQLLWLHSARNGQLSFPLRTCKVGEGEGCPCDGCRERFMFEDTIPISLAASRVVIAILGGSPGFGLPARIAASRSCSRPRCAAGARRLPCDRHRDHAISSACWRPPLPPMRSNFWFLPTAPRSWICALWSAFPCSFSSIGEPSHAAWISSCSCSGSASHMALDRHPLSSRPFRYRAEGSMGCLSVAVAIVASLCVLARFPGCGRRRALDRKLIAFGRGVRHGIYTAMAGCAASSAVGAGSSSCQGLRLRRRSLVVVAVLCFVIAAAFCCRWGRSPRRQVAAVSAQVAAPCGHNPTAMSEPRRRSSSFRPISAPHRRPWSSPLTAPCFSCRVAGRGRHAFHRTPGAQCATDAIIPASIRHPRADVPLVESRSGRPSSIPLCSGRVHRSLSFAIPHVSCVRNEGDGAVIELAGPSPHRVSVSRAKARSQGEVGLARRHALRLALSSVILTSFILRGRTAAVGEGRRPHFSRSVHPSSSPCGVSAPHGSRLRMTEGPLGRGG